MQLAAEIRTFLVAEVARSGGHLGPNLGVVELCVALHLTYDFRTDRLIWDTGHQIYPHKLITGRYERFQSIRTKGGLMGFPHLPVAGDLGQPPGGFPAELQKKVLKGKSPLTQRPGSYLKDVDLEAERAKVEKETGEPVDDFRLASYLMYPKVFADFTKSQDRYGPTAVLPTPVLVRKLPSGS